MILKKKKEKNQERTVRGRTLFSGTQGTPTRRQPSTHRGHVYRSLLCQAAGSMGIVTGSGDRARVDGS